MNQVAEKKKNSKLFSLRLWAEINTTDAELEMMGMMEMIEDVKPACHRGNYE